MPTARSETAAIEIPDFGILVVGGCNRDEGKLRTAEVLNVKAETCTTIAPLNDPRQRPVAVSFQGSVIVAGDYYDRSHTIEQLKISLILPRQWTIVNCEISVEFAITSLCIFNENLLVTCKLKHL